jgi:High potential iron-sulfur protein
MKKLESASSEVLSRRSVLVSAGWMVGAATLAAVTASNAIAQSKVSKSAVAYQDTPKGAQRCDNCALFQAPNACKNVAGDVSPAGWCKIYAKKG